MVNAATPVIMPWLDDVDAVLWAGLPGQEGGHAVAAALLGDIEPAGRLVTTFPTDDGAAPAWSSPRSTATSPTPRAPSSATAATTPATRPQPAFWFGHGLGYSTWEYGAAATVASDDGCPHASRSTVTNTGSRASREVVQVYSGPAEPDQPVRLVGWQAVTRRARCDRSTVEVTTDPRMWRRWDTDAERLGPARRRRRAAGRPRPGRHPGDHQGRTEHYGLVLQPDVVAYGGSSRLR